MGHSIIAGKLSCMWIRVPQWRGPGFLGMSQFHGSTFINSLELASMNNKYSTKKYNRTCLFLKSVIFIYFHFHLPIILLLSSQLAIMWTCIPDIGCVMQTNFYLIIEKQFNKFIHQIITIYLLL